MSLSIKSHRPRRSGVILVLSLGMTMVLAWLTVEILDSVRKELALKSAPADHGKLRHTAYQLLELSIGVIAEVDRFEGGIYTPSQGWGFPLSYVGIKDSNNLDTALSGRERPQEFRTPDEDEEEGFFEAEDDIGADELLSELMAEDSDSGEDSGFVRAITRVMPEEETSRLSPDTTELIIPDGLQARVRIYDESGKLSATRTSPERWLVFFEEMGFEESEAKNLTDCLLDWTDADQEERENGAENEIYAQEEPPYVAANRPLRDFYELRLVETFKDLFFDERGIPNEFFAIFTRNVSLYNTSDVNLNTASELVLRTLAEEQDFDEDNLLDFIAGSDLEFGSEDDRVFRPGLDEDDLPKDENGDPLQLFREIRFVSAEIAVSAGQTIFYLNAILDLEQKHPGGVYPYRIIRVAENQPIS